MKTSMLLPHPLFLSLWNNRTLVTRLAVRDIQSRYRGTMLGAVWALALPLATVLTYLFVFTHIFKAQWDEGSGTTGEYALIFFAGLLVFNFFAECLNRAPGLMLEDRSYIKRMVFPLEILPWVCLATALFHAALGGCVLMASYLVVLGAPPPTALLAPLVCLPLVFFVLGLLWLLASLGVYLRDLKPMINVATTFLLFLSPVLYPASALKGRARTLMWLNPLTGVLEDVRGLLFWAATPGWGTFLAALAVSVAWAWLGYLWFMKTKQGFADVV